MRVGTRILGWVLGSFAKWFGVPPDRLLMYLLVTKQTTMTRATFEHMRDPNQPLKESLSGTGKAIAREVNALDTPDGLLEWLPENSTVKEEDLSGAQIESIAVFLFFFFNFRQFMRVILVDAQRVPANAVESPLVKHWIERAQFTFFVLAHVQFNELVRCAPYRPVRQHNRTCMYVCSQTRVVYVAKLLVVLSDHLQYNIATSGGRAARHSLGEGVESMMKAITEANQNGHQDLQRRGIEHLVAILLDMWEMNNVRDRKACYTSSMKIPSLPYMKAAKKRVRKKFFQSGWHRVVKTWHAWDRSYIGEDGTVHYDSYFAEQENDKHAERLKAR